MSHDPKTDGGSENRCRENIPGVYRYENTFELAVMLIIKRKEYQSWRRPVLRLKYGICRGGYRSGV
jgi:hypothetical protein